MQKRDIRAVGTTKGERRATRPELGVLGAVSVVLAVTVGACDGETTIGVGDGGEGGESVGDAGDSSTGGTRPIAGSGGASYGGRPPTFSGGPSVGGDTNTPGGASDGGEGPGPIDFPGEPLSQVSKLDLLLVVDNSFYMAPKQDIFRRSVGKLLGRLTAQGLEDIHVGVISTSLGARGGDVCSEPASDDQAHLIPTMRSGVSSWNGQGFTKWDPASNASPPGHADAEEFAAEVDAALASVGSTGCGYEASLESWYRFLVDPEPYATVPLQGEPTGIDKVLLGQRAEFLRPDSAVAIVLLTDENDCSFDTDGQGWLTGLQELNGTAFRMPPARSVCAANPEDPCCSSCASADPEPGCLPASEDPACAQAGLSSEEDHMNLRCWDQKRRFGVDLLYPVDRYVRGLSSPGVPARYSRGLAPNPLFAAAGGQSRRPTHVLFAAIVGVPWQDVADEDSLNGPGLSLLTAPQLATENRWSLMLPGASGLPGDVFMQEANRPRTGTHPLTGDSMQSAASGEFNAINGHESDLDFNLQNACTFAVEPTDCSSESSCECFGPQQAVETNFECQAPDGSYGNVQYRTGTTPGTRPLQVLSRIGSSAVVGSACPKILDSEDADGDYRPTLDRLLERVSDIVR